MIDYAYKKCAKYTYTYTYKTKIENISKAYVRAYVRIAYRVCV